MSFKNIFPIVFIDNGWQGKEGRYKNANILKTKRWDEKILFIVFEGFANKKLKKYNLYGFKKNENKYFKTWFFVQINSQASEKNLPYINTYIQGDIYKYILYIIHKYMICIYIYIYIYILYCIIYITFI